MRTLCHTRNGELRHAHERLAVEVDHAVHVLGRSIHGAEEFAVAAGIKEQRYLGLRFLKSLSEFVKAFLLCEVKREYTAGNGKGACQLFKPVPTPCDEPELIKNLAFGVIKTYLFGKFHAHSGACAGDNGNTHYASFLLSYFWKKGKGNRVPVI